jgi:uncharacterized protein (DUF885 family)
VTKKSPKASSLNIALLADDIFERLALQFPVCLSSDEFHFFPQLRIADQDWSRWDDFSPPAVRDLRHEIVQWNRKLHQAGSGVLSQEEQIDVDLLRRVLRTIVEQLTEVLPQHRQPTFYLTILGIGLAEAIEAGPQTINARLGTLPDFLHHARENLSEIPSIFRDQGLEMIAATTPWLQSLPAPAALLTEAVVSLNRLREHLEQIAVIEEFLPPVDVYERIASRHMGCGLPTTEIAQELDREIAETGNFLQQSVAEISPGITWQEFVANLPSPPLPPGGVKQLYLAMIQELADHCREIGLTTGEFTANCPVRVENIPEYMLPVRSNAAYSMPPGHPPKGGTFFIMESDKEELVSPDYRLLTAHETYPGHHLLDGRRWSLPRPARRPLEFPIFYEGWASLSEELLFDTGFFSDPIERILLAKRRFWRAMRGRVDLDIHTRRRNLDEAATFLVDQGMERERAATMVRRYIQKPGYQLAYTVGRRKFRRIYERFLEKNGNPVVFARRVLAQGEIGFDHLETHFFGGNDS